MKKVFISYHCDPDRPLDKPFAQLIAFYLTKQPDLNVFCFSIPWANTPEQHAEKDWEAYASLFLDNRDVFVLCVGGALEVLDQGKKVTTGQMKEFNSFINEDKALDKKKMIVVHLGNRISEDVPKKFVIGNHMCMSVTSHTNEIPDECELKKQGKCYCLRANKNLPNNILSSYNGTEGKKLLSDIATLHQNAEHTAKEIFNFLCKPDSSPPLFWNEGLPQSNIYGYEKDVIEAMKQINSRKFGDDRHFKTGSPLRWEGDNVKRWKKEETKYVSYRTPLKESLAEKSEDFAQEKRIGVSTRVNSEDTDPPLTFNEARPRKNLFLPLKENENSQRSDKLVIGIVCVGGIAPGINSVVHGLVERHWQYWDRTQKTNDNKYTLEIRLIRDGFAGLVDIEAIKKENIKDFTPHKIPKPCKLTFFPEDTGSEEEKKKTEDAKRDMRRLKNHMNRAGSLSLPTGRFDKLTAKSTDRFKILKNIVGTITGATNENDKLDVLYVIGGQGALRTTHALSFMARENNIRIVGIPKAIDNDILWVWQSFGFVTAVNKATEIMEQIHDEIRSQPRLAIVKTFGSDSGFIVSHVALGAGQVCMAALIPELNFSLESLGNLVVNDFMERTQKERENAQEPDSLDTRMPYGAIIMGETALPIDVEDFLISEQDYGLSDAEVTSVRSFTGSAYFPNTIEIEPYKDKVLLKNNKTENHALTWLKYALHCLNKDTETPNTSALNQVIKEGVIRGFKNKVAEKNYETALEMSNEMALLMNDASVQVQNNNYEIEAASAWWEKKIEEYEKPVSSPLKSALERLKAVRSLPFEAFAIIEEIQRVYADCKTQAKEQLKEETQQDPTIEDVLVKTQGLFNSEIGKEAWKKLMTSLGKRVDERLRRTLIEQAYYVVTPNGEDLAIPHYPSEQVRRQVKGTSESSLRDAGMKLISKYIELRFKENDNLKDIWVFINEPKQLIRSVPPSCHDIIYANRLAKLAVDNAMAGCTDFMISQWNTEYVLVPLELVVLGRKRVPLEGIFWKSVIASTGQPVNLWYGESKAN